MKFLCDRAATNHFPTLQHERLETALRQIKRGYECIMTAADENNALSERHGQLCSLGDVGGAELDCSTEVCAASTGSGGSAFGALREEELLLACRAAVTIFCQSFRITWLAMRPGAPMIPPPGWVADPHMYRLSIGVR